MKNFKLIILLCLTIVMLLSCKKEETKSLAAKLDNNTMMFNGKTLNVYNSGKTTYVQTSCNGLGLVGGFYVYASNSSRDSVELFVYNLASYSGKNNVVEFGLSGNACKIYVLGNFKLGGGVSTYIKSGYSGIVEFDGSTCLFREESIGVNVPPNLFTYSPQISYPCYWKCSF
jgi:hypothetical protein